MQHRLVVFYRFRPVIAMLTLLAFVTLPMIRPLLVVPVVSAASPNDFILSDADIFDVKAMSVERVRSFLQRQDGFLADYTISDNGTTKSAAELIVEVGQEFGLSPKFFLTLLQKEQSLVTDPSPSQNQLDYALGYGCPSSCSPAYRGFATQLRAAAKRIRDDYLPALQSSGQFNGWGPGIAKQTVDSVVVTPANIATAVLYIYNPYVGNRGGGDPRYGGNSLFRFLWQKWFVRKYPNGSLLRVQGQSGIWLIRDGQRSAFRSKAAFLANYDYAKVIVVDRGAIATYDVGPPILYPEPSLLQVQNGGVYLLSNGMKRPIASRKVLRLIGYNPEEIIRGVDEADLSGYPKGPPITEADVFPEGRLVRSQTTGAVFFIDSANVKHIAHSKEIYRSRFRYQRSEPVSDDFLQALPAGEPMKFRDGELIASRTDRKVYFVSNGARRYIPDIESFRELGFKTKNIIFTNDRAIAAQPLGEPLSDVTVNN
ncbi:MAG: hypothetical protein HY420_02370 [Candidatus Kerfeldbacteria bacterium]|nr:hypothetical protein [Candidatus Kerfeldbacteria bacterium]